MSETSTIDILERGMRCLLDQLGTIETERFISAILREQFDYTKWRRGYFGEVTVQELNDAAVAYAQSHPFQPKRNQIPLE